MGPEEPLQSPFASSDSPQAPRQPAPVEPDSPRLGILHLLVLTACAAFCMGITRALRLAFSSDPTTPPFGGFEAAAGTLYGIGAGAALAGLLLFLARRWRGSPFPLHPGEYLLAITGVVVLCRLVQSVQLLLYSFRPSVFTWAFELLLLGIHSVIFFWVLIRVKVLRWRMFFLTIPASFILMVLLARHRIYHWVGVSRGLPFLVLMVVVLMDHRQGKRYPWTHWFGVGTRLWFDAAAIGMSLWWALFRSTPP